jgi:hypothetical protein
MSRQMTHRFMSGVIRFARDGRDLKFIHMDNG